MKGQKHCTVCQGSGVVYDEDHGYIVAHCYVDNAAIVEFKSPLPTTSKEQEKLLIEMALIRARGNQRQAALLINMPKSTLHDKLKTYSINPRDYKKPAVTNAAD